MGKEPHNIKRLVKQNEEYAHADHHALYLLRENVKTKWFEHDLQRSAGGQPIIPGQEETTAKSWVTRHIPTELKMANDAVKLQRAARLKERYALDTLQHEKELQAMGLALVKHRD